MEDISLFLVLKFGIKLYLNDKERLKKIAKSSDFSKESRTYSCFLEGHGRDRALPDKLKSWNSKFVYKRWGIVRGASVSRQEDHEVGRTKAENPFETYVCLEKLTNKSVTTILKSKDSKQLILLIMFMLQLSLKCLPLILLRKSSSEVHTWGNASPNQHCYRLN